MHPDVAVALIEAVPRVLWVLLAAVLLFHFERYLRSRLLPRMTSLDVLGVEASFVKEELDEIVSRRAPEVSKGDRDRVLRRLRRVAPVFRGAALLWVHDDPDATAAERAMLRFAGAEVDVARSVEGALAKVGERAYDAVVSDMRRGGDADAGLALLDALRGRSPGTPLVFYVGEEDAGRAVPRGAFDLTARPDVLLHAIADVLERRRS